VSTPQRSSIEAVQKPNTDDAQRGVGAKVNQKPMVESAGSVEPQVT
jgi:hypothetical protein